MPIAASIALNDESSITQSLTRVGIELLGQLKITSELICFHGKVVLGFQFLDTYVLCTNSTMCIAVISNNVNILPTNTRYGFSPPPPQGEGNARYPQGELWIWKEGAGGVGVGVGMDRGREDRYLPV